MASTIITPLSAPTLLAPFLPALPAATVSKEPALGILPLLTPILRQRVQLLATSSTEPWLRLLCYDTAKVAKLTEIVKNEALEPHPVSGEVEVDWDYDSQTRFRRVDDETLQALVVLSELGLAFQLVFCTNDPDGEKDGWKVGEVTVAEKPAPFSQFGGASSIEDAERLFKDGTQARRTPAQLGVPTSSSPAINVSSSADDEDDGYWDRYDATPARTPADSRSPAPPTPAAQPLGEYRAASAEDDYFAQYDDVQPAMDNHDPDEEAAAAHIVPPLGLGREAAEATTIVHPQPKTNGSLSHPQWASTDADVANRDSSTIAHPRPESSASSNGSHTVARLEETAGKQEQNEFGVKQHVSRSIRSLYMLSRASGIEREEFERLVKTELDLLAMVDEQE